MNLITATELRTKTRTVINALLAGRSLNLVHRSQIIGTIKPMDIHVKTLSSHSLRSKIDTLGLPTLTSKDIDRRYRAAMTEKHGKSFS